ncbi:Phosphoglycolate phosphatase, HAD superfamily [Pseudidiomarina planktonica]|uniref:phosphoglycolate phosphatase n=1 Tax=Pseudidiomarina planktonica TaxID=1323738 RepID=A0A1Y6ENZ6_9GAMM|nr:HAD hydrolase-like protein [Pseudidiomarina planktonica]RUO65859.1 HAD family hydrolase [Pseudidiomarina planktonica]SMQ62242.1 Phosphoglycolate phosphatase, HAD superfamily [Pseudidiomarina planktonica]
MKSHYQHYLFDCDGVILDANRVKTDAFGDCAEVYGSAAKADLVAYHQQTGGVSRYQKFRWLLDKYAPQASEADYQALLECYAQRVYDQLLSCASAPGLTEFRAQTSASSWTVISGGDQKELRDIFKQRGLAKLFDGGIFGSPTDKMTHLEQLITAGVEPQTSLFIGDSIYDLQCAKAFAIDSVFVSDWSEVSPETVRNQAPQTPIFKNIAELATALSGQSMTTATSGNKDSEHG